MYFRGYFLQYKGCTVVLLSLSNGIISRWKNLHRKSGFHPIAASVPQRSVLGLLYLMYCWHLSHDCNWNGHLSWWYNNHSRKPITENCHKLPAASHQQGRQMGLVVEDQTSPPENSARNFYTSQQRSQALCLYQWCSDSAEGIGQVPRTSYRF